VDATSSINVTCSSGTPYQISLSDGSNFNSTRRMAWGNSYIAYDLFSDSNRSQSWSSTAPVQGNGSGSTQQIPLYGRIFSGQAVPNTGSYADTIIATISY
jgi:spore coat protein U-like protein